MSKVLFINGNLHGHINPTLPVVQELVNQGEEVFYFSTTEFQEKIEAIGATFMDYGDEFTAFLHSFRPSGNHPFYTLLEYMLAMDSIVIPLVIDKIRSMKFDYILHDIMFGGGNVIARQLNLPAISTCSSFVIDNLPVPPRMLEPGFHPQLDHFYEEFHRVKRDWQRAQLVNQSICHSFEDFKLIDLFFKKEDLNLVFTSKMFQPKGDSFDDTFLFVGPSIANREEKLDFPLDNTGAKSLIYISMGTINNKCDTFYNHCIEAFGEENYQVIMSVGSKIEIATLNQIPSNFIVGNYIPQLEVLKHTDVMLSHGGLNSVSEALYYGVPLIVLPQANDQPMVAQQLINLKAGIELKIDEITPEILRASVHKLLSDNTYKDNCTEIRKSFLQAGGYKKAVAQILNYRNGRGENF